ncbi:MAG: AI-2E family transporter [bacterium]|nr:AI-2E family transporter [bacterium]
MATEEKVPTKLFKVDISYKTFFFALFLIIALKFLVSIFDLLILVYLAFLLALGLDPIVSLLTRLKLRRSIAVFISFIFTFALLIGFFVLIIPPLIDQTQKLTASLPYLLGDIQISQIDYKQFSFLIDRFSDLPLNVLKTVMGVAGNLINFFTLIVMAFYISVEKPFFPRYIARTFGKTKLSQSLISFLELIDQQLTRWLLGELVLMLFIGTLSYIGLMILNIPYALPLAMLAGLLEVVPNLGPIISAIPPIIIGMTISPITAIGVLGWYFLVQQVENNLLVPKIIGLSVGLHPFLILFTLMIGFKLAGVGGALLAVPILVTLKVGLQVYLLQRR